MEAFGRKIKGFDRPDAILAGVEGRTSSPVRIPRGETLESSVKAYILVVKAPDMQEASPLQPWMV